MNFQLFLNFSVQNAIDLGLYPAPEGLPSQMRSKAPHANFFFQLKNAGNSTLAC